MGMIFGSNGYDKLLKGYETQVNDTLRRSYAVAPSDTAGVLPGDLLITTSAPQVYERAKAALTGTQKVAGIALATNVKVDPRFPMSAGDIAFEPGDRGVVVIRGSIAVQFTGTAPVEGAAVNWDYTNRAFTTSTTGSIALPGMRFTGRVEGNVAEVYVQYI